MDFLHIDLINLAALVVSGVLAGFINTIAGGGSILTLPALMLLGMPADIANATNRVGVFLQSVAAMHGFRQHGKLSWDSLWPILIPTVGGSLVGSLVASYLSPALLKPLLLGTMITMMLVILLRPQLIPTGDSQPFTLQERPAGAVWLFVCGLYGGFVQAGVGFLLIAALAGTLRYDLIRANALKMTCTGVFGLVALVVFVARGQVEWVPGLIMGLSTIVGVRMSVRYALNANHKTLKAWLLGMALVVCVAALLK